MNWSDVGNWVKDNAGTGASLIGSLLTGNAPGALAAGISLVSGATGTDNPSEALASLQSNPETRLKLKELYYANEESIRKHIETNKRLELEDQQRSHEETQKTIRNADNAEDRVVKWTRPLQSWFSLVGAIAYVFASIDDIDFTVLGLLLTLPWTYAGLRQIGKGIDSFKKAEPTGGNK